MPVIIRCKQCRDFYYKTAENHVEGNLYKCPKCEHEQETGT
jgi:predicted RNA-binding Zn-ribbon protein involved in translation (DUF1610 family)